MHGFHQYVENTPETFQLRSYLKNPPRDLASYGYELLRWRRAEDLFDRVGITADQFEKVMDDHTNDYYTLCNKLAAAMTEREWDDFVGFLHQEDPANAPSDSLLSLDKSERKGMLRPDTWLVHFSDDASSIKHQGFKYGQHDMTRLALTTHLSMAAKKFGGYNFAFEADSRDAKFVARSGKYGNEAVMFQAAGVPTYHSSDNEYQIIFWGKSVDPAKAVLLTQDSSGDWVVENNGREYVKGDYEKCVQWVMTHYRQYRRVF